jgi:uncharacterized protein YwgA
MQKNSEYRHDVEKAADIIRDAGGQVTGRTRLQKMAYLLEISGLGEGFSFEYRHYGPYSEQLTNAISSAQHLGLVTEKEYPTSWGGFYSVFKASTDSRENAAVQEARSSILKLGVEANPVALELAATAAFLAKDGETDPWGETARRKPEKASAQISNAKSLYARLQAVNTPERIPEIAST